MNIYFVSLGCDKNLVDSEVMLGFLADAGYGVAQDVSEAEIAIVNTCGFILDAQQESVNTILEMADLKDEGKLKALLVCGCLAQRYGDELLKEIPQIDAILGTMALPEIVDAVNDVLKGKNVEILPDIDRALPEYKRRIVTTGGYYAYLKIAEGCDKCCTYCAIPSMRGKYRSYPMEKLVEEAKQLVSDVGVKELILVAQECTLYGVDLYGKKSLSKLLNELCRIEELRWIRILYCYPEEIDEELMETIASEEKICHYLDVPIQHASDKILKKMGRRTTGADLEEKIAMMRRIVPDICIRTTLISGFPTEEEEDHQILMKFVEEMRFDRLGVFCYSKEKGTPAAKMKGQIPKKVKEARRDALMLLQQKIAFEKAEDRIGSELEVIIDGRIPEEGIYVARSYMDAPEVDGFVFVETERELMSGDLVKVKITDANKYDLIGVLSDEYSE